MLCNFTFLITENNSYCFQEKKSSAQKLSLYLYNNASKYKVHITAIHFLTENYILQNKKKLKYSKSKFFTLIILLTKQSILKLKIYPHM